MDETRYAWAAGILEGEGSFFTQTRGYSPKVSCQMTDKDVLDELSNIFGGNVFEIKKRKQHWKDAWGWNLSGDSAKDCMQKILPYMKSRRTEKIKQVIELWEREGRPYKYPRESARLAAQAWIDGEGSLRSLQKIYGVGYESIRQEANKIISTS